MILSCKFESKQTVCEPQPHSCAGPLNCSLLPPPLHTGQTHRGGERNTTNSGMWSLHGQLYSAQRKCFLIERRKPHPQMRLHSHREAHTRPCISTPAHIKTMKENPHANYTSKIKTQSMFDN